MAQGDTVTTDLNGLVEATFQLDFKAAEVKRRPDADKFAELRFRLGVSARKASFFPSPDAPEHANPVVIDLTKLADDPTVLVIFSFVGNKADGSPRFQLGDSIDLACFYSSKDGESAAGGEQIALGTVRLQAAKS